MADVGSGGKDMRVAVIGTGIMGAAMASNLIAAGLPTTVWDRSPDATAPLADAGARVAASAREAVGDAQVVITMLPTADVVTSVMFGGGVAGALADGAVWAQMGTIGVTATAEIASQLGQVRPGALFVDAPVSGSKGPAQAGQLLIRASGPQQAGPIVEPVFSVIGRKTVWLGPAGQGSRMKLAVNAYMSTLIEGVAEALERAGRLGSAGRARWAPTPASSRRRARAPRWTRRSPGPSCTRWSAATSRPSSRCSGRSRTSTWRSRSPASTRRRCWWPCPGSGTPPLTPGTDGRTSRPRSWRCTATISSRARCSGSRPG